MIGNIDILVKELCKLPKEVGWVEFKHNNCEPTMVGEDISALANSATLNDRDYAYMIWGVDDGSHEIIGTKVRLQLEKKGEQKVWRTGFFTLLIRTRILSSKVRT
jgi:predicted HTH transcriptional regulator